MRASAVIPSPWLTTPPRSPARGGAFVLMVAALVVIGFFAGKLTSERQNLMNFDDVTVVAMNSESPIICIDDGSSNGLCGWLATAGPMPHVGDSVSAVFHDRDIDGLGVLQIQSP